MTDIRCPSCNAVFEMDASGYTEIVNQIKSEEFEKELNIRLKEVDSNHQMKIQLAENNIATEKDKEIEKIKIKGFREKI